MFFFTFFCVCCPALFYLLFFMIHLSFNFLLSSSAHPLLLSPVLFILLFYSLYEKMTIFFPLNFSASSFCASFHCSILLLLFSVLSYFYICILVNGISLRTLWFMYFVSLLWKHDKLLCHLHCARVELFLFLVSFAFFPAWLFLADPILLLFLYLLTYADWWMFIFLLMFITKVMN